MPSSSVPVDVAENPTAAPVVQRFHHPPIRLNLKVGEPVEVRSKEEILATLDEQGCYESLPFMPEMLKHCGKRFRVYKSAHKTCDTIDYSGARKLNGVVHLEGLRCDGAFHGGCQAGCIFFWKEAWLKRVDSGVEAISFTGSPRCSEEGLFEATRKSDKPTETSAAQEPVYRCQATEMNRASSFLPWWDLRQYVKDVTSGNVSIFRIIGGLLFWMFTKLLRVGGYRALIWCYDTIQKKIGGIPYPFKAGSCDKTPSLRLNLQPGELVEVKNQQEILATVNSNNRNRGLSFDEEMVGFCGGQYRVLRRVEKIINEKTGRMMHLPGDCIVLDGVTCQSRFKADRHFCPRSIYPYWREIWLNRVQEKTQEQR
jgi:hypothetical protein